MRLRYGFGMGDPRKRMDHVSPEWVRYEADYFVTVCGKPRKENQFCHPSRGPVVLDSIGYRHDKGIWFCHLALLMPDHVHLLLGFPDIPRISLVIGDWKRWVAHHHGISWQENFFEHRVRREESLGDKAEYMLQNPVRAGLIREAPDWPYTWIPQK